MAEWILHAIIIYLILSLALTVSGLMRMYRIRRRAGRKDLGRQRMRQLALAGRFRQYPLYSADEIKDNRHKGAARISVFLADEVDDKPKPYVVVCPGGGYAHLVTAYEGYPIAARINELGYTAFVLEYRAGFDCSSHAPMHDLARAIQFIENHAEEYSIEVENYAIVGFSAGGNLAGVFGTKEWGYKRYGVRRPATLMLAYPWTNINHWIEHPYWNIWNGILGIVLSERGNIFMFGAQSMNREKRDSICVQKWITDDYPPTYMFAGGNDVLVPSGSHTDVLAKELKAHDIPLMYEKFFAVPHGIGLGEGTNADGWLSRAVEYWQDNIKTKKGEV